MKGDDNYDMEGLVHAKQQTQKLSGQVQRLFLRVLFAVLGIVAVVTAGEAFGVTNVTPYLRLDKVPDSEYSSLKEKRVEVPQDKFSGEEIPLQEKSIKELQIENYKKGTALLVNVHITHHAGTAICHTMRQFGPSPKFACMGAGGGPWPPEAETGRKGLFSTWSSYEEAASRVQMFRPYFHFLSFEFIWWGNLHQVYFEYDNLVTIIPLRHPIDRFLAGGKCPQWGHVIKSDPNETNQADYWGYANSDCADNYALRILANNSNCHDGADTSLECLESAKNLLRRFTFVLDQDCLGESMVALGNALNLTIPYTAPKKSHRPARDRINNDTLWEFLNHRFRRDIELYEWSKSLSIVKC